MRPHDLAAVSRMASEIKERFGNEILERDFSTYAQGYVNLVGFHPGDNWMSRMGWSQKIKRELRGMLGDAGIHILPNPITPPHDYELHEIGFKRLNEIERRIAATKK